MVFNQRENCVWEVKLFGEDIKSSKVRKVRQKRGDGVDNLRRAQKSKWKVNERLVKKTC